MRTEPMKCYPGDTQLRFPQVRPGDLIKYETMYLVVQQFIRTTPFYTRNGPYESLECQVVVWINLSTCERDIFYLTPVADSVQYVILPVIYRGGKVIYDYTPEQLMNL